MNSSLIRRVIANEVINASPVLMAVGYSLRKNQHIVRGNGVVINNNNHIGNLNYSSSSHAMSSSLTYQPYRNTNNSNKSIYNISASHFSNNFSLGLRFYSNIQKDTDPTATTTSTSSSSPSNTAADPNTTTTTDAATTSTSTSPSTPPPKETLKEKIAKVAKHYWLGTKLLGKNIKLTVQLIKRLSKGYTLSRRERSLLVQTSADIIRLVPFIIIMIVPFLEFALPVLLKLFPSLLPSTYEWKNEQEEHKTNKLKGNITMAKFLQDTLGDISVELKSNNIVKSKEFHDFMVKVKSGAPVSGTEILTFSQLFRDEITMEKITRPQLLAMHKYLAGGSFVAKWYSNDYLKQQINRKLKKIKQDDILIKKEGLDALTLEELVDAALVRGFKVEGYTRKQIEHQLEQWLDLSLNKSVPSSLLILSRAFTLTSSTTAAEALEDTLEHIPQEALDEVVKKLPVGGVFEEGSVERAQEKLEELSKEAEQLEKENKADTIAATESEDKKGEEITKQLEEVEQLKEQVVSTGAPQILEGQLKELVEKIDDNIKEIGNIANSDPIAKENEKKAAEALEEEKKQHSKI